MVMMELDARNFDDVIGDRFVMVEFYAPWCTACKKFAPSYENIAEYFANREDVVIAKIDAYSEKSLSQRYDITGFPTVLYFEKGNTKPYRFKGTNVLKMVTLIEEVAGRFAKKYNTNVKFVTSWNFTTTIVDNDKHALVELYDKAHDECRKLYPVFERVASVYKNDPDILFGRVDLSRDTDRYLLEHYHVHALPAYLWFPQRTKRSKLAGRIPSIDPIIAKYSRKIQSGDTASTREDILRASSQLTTDIEIKYVDYYLAVLKKIQEKGVSFVHEEIQRVNNIIGGKVSKEKLDDMTRRGNILRHILEYTDGSTRIGIEGEVPGRKITFSNEKEEL
ncbi:uncharacterized protein LOC102802611 [Saccoglossus kowalevskii]|uniref:protein disulfide-isomerase n=1 Tax=Saccoglossus kowalevskii TaxID=10224 RepID=A0ABM0MYU7_SACKO|nr:PREDICTED: protein disulfide-isomerase 1-like [Saccoglossus kowalevskii]